DTAMLHVVDVASPDDMSTGMRVRARWAEQRPGSIRDIACFEPAIGERAALEPAAAVDPVQIMISPLTMTVQHSASLQETRYLHGLKEGKFIGQRCSVCQKVYIPPRSACPVDGVPTVEDVELPDRGIVTTYCFVNVP